MKATAAPLNTILKLCLATDHFKIYNSLAVILQYNVKQQCSGRANNFFSFKTESDEKYFTGIRHVKYGREIDHKYAYKLCIRNNKLKITNKKSVQTLALYPRNVK
jgi:hypothetical protein